MVRYTGRGKKSAIFGKNLTVGHQMVPFTGRVKKSAIFGKTLTVGHQMVPYTGRVRQSAICGKTLTVGHQIVPYTAGKTLTLSHKMVPCTDRVGISAILAALWHLDWSSNEPKYQVTGEKCSFWHHFVNGPKQSDWIKVQFFAPLCYWATRCSHIQAN